MRRFLYALYSRRSSEREDGLRMQNGPGMGGVASLTRLPSRLTLNAQVEREDRFVKRLELESRFENELRRGDIAGWGICLSVQHIS